MITYSSLVGLFVPLVPHSWLKLAVAILLGKDHPCSRDVYAFVLLVKGLLCGQVLSSYFFSLQALTCNCFTSYKASTVIGHYFSLGNFHEYYFRLALTN